MGNFCVALINDFKRWLIDLILYQQKEMTDVEGKLNPTNHWAAVMIFVNRHRLRLQHSTNLRASTPPLQGHHYKVTTYNVQVSWAALARKPSKWTF